MSIFDRFKKRPMQVPTCKEAHEFLYDYVDGSIDPALLEKFEQHMRMCPNCTTYLEQYRHTISLLNSAEPLSPPSELVDHTLSFLNQALDQDRTSEV